MKKILVRSGMTPFDDFDPVKMIVDNTIGYNVGNLVYAYGVIRMLMANDDIEIYPDYYDIERRRITSKKAAEYSEKYDAYVIPLADAFRSGFEDILMRLTDAIKKLTIPVIVIGVGLGIRYDASLEDDLPVSAAVKKFVSAVLKKSEAIGVRGEITAEYLKKLGFPENRVKIIGCPSLYAKGPNLKIRDPNIKDDSKVIITNSPLADDSVHEFMKSVVTRFPNYYFIPQWRRELMMIYLGASLYKNGKKKSYPSNVFDPVYAENRARFFLNVPTWMKFVSDADLAIGPRFHGCVVPILEGVPTVMIVKDMRMKELAEFHHLTHITLDDIQNGVTIDSLCKNIDFHSIEKVHKANYENYIAFLDLNNMPHLEYSGENEPERVIFDELIAAHGEFRSPVEVITSCKKREKVNRWSEYVNEVEAFRSTVIKRSENQPWYVKAVMNMFT